MHRVIVNSNMRLLDTLKTEHCREMTAIGPGLWAAMDALKRGYTLIVRWRDRLARDVYLAEYLNKEAERKGCKIEAAEESNGDSPQDILIRQVACCNVRSITGRLSKNRTKYAMLKYQNRGKRIMSCKLPYGFKPDPEKKGLHDRGTCRAGGYQADEGYLQGNRELSRDRG